jgi:phosphoesterase RecJ-like protein
MSLKSAAAFVRKQNNFLIAVHTNPEGDALGAQIAFYLLLKKLGKSAIMVNEDDVPYGYTFLPEAQNIRKFGRSSMRLKFDCMAVLDCSDLDRTGEIAKLNTAHRPVLNIDHHISNNNFGDVRWVEPYASSTCEMIFKLYKKLKVPIDKDAALLLYVGISTDTGSFRYSNTTSHTHKVTAELLRHKLNVPFVYRNIYENIPYQDMLLLARILPGMKREAGGKIVWFQIHQGMLKNKKLCFDLSEHVLSYGRSIKDAEVVVLFKENLGVKNEIRVNFRSQGKVDVNRIANYFGGGGHRTASGATVHGTLENIRKKVLNKIKQALK